MLKLHNFEPEKRREKLLVKARGRNYIAFMARAYTKFSKMPHILAGVLLCAGFGILVYLGLLGSSVPVYSVAELLEAEQNKRVVNLKNLQSPEDLEQDRVIQIYGNVAKLVEQENLKILLQDQKMQTNEIIVSYAGIIPNNLKLGQAIFLTGKYNSANNEFLAYELVTSCPTKYQVK